MPLVYGTTGRMQLDTVEHCQRHFARLSRNLERCKDGKPNGYGPSLGRAYLRDIDRLLDVYADLVIAELEKDAA